MGMPGGGPEAVGSPSRVTPVDMLALDAVSQAAAVRARAVSACDLVDASIAAVSALDSRLNAVVHRRFARARAEAELWDERLARGTAGRAPFAGVPLMIKDVLCHTAGDPYWLGMRILRDRKWMTDTDTVLARRFRDAGFVLVGKTNAPELATAYTTEPVSTGATRNPWDVAFSAGGSSGGSAAAVAAGMVAVAHGNDMGGSIRVPASACGIVGLKPTHGLISLAPDFGDYWAMLAHEGVLTRTVADTAAVLDAVSGASPGDPCPAPHCATPLSVAVRRTPARLRVGVRTQVPGLDGPAHPDCIAAVERVSAELSDAGHRVAMVPVRALDDAGLAEPFTDVFSVSVDRDIRRWEQTLGTEIRADDVEPRNWTLVMRGRSVSGTAYVAAIEYLQAYSRRVAADLADLDLLVTPTLPEPIPKLGFLGTSPSLAEVAHLGEFTAPFNITGQPAMSVPAYVASSGRPVGVQLVAPYGRDDVLLSVAAELEQRIGWAHVHPGVSIWPRGDTRLASH